MSNNEEMNEPLTPLDHLFTILEDSPKFSDMVNHLSDVLSEKSQTFTINAHLGMLGDEIAEPALMAAIYANTYDGDLSVGNLQDTLTQMRASIDAMLVCVATAEFPP